MISGFETWLVDFYNAHMDSHVISRGVTFIGEIVLDFKKCILSRLKIKFHQMTLRYSGNIVKYFQTVVYLRNLSV